MPNPVAPQPIEAPPPAPTANHTREQFVPLAFAFMQWQAKLRNGAYNIAQNVYQNAQRALTYATNASSSAASAASAKDAAQAAAATAAQAPTASGTSNNSLAIATGALTLTTNTGRAFVPGQYVAIANTQAPATRSMWGTVVAYNSANGQMQVHVGRAMGSGTHAGWTISIAQPNLPASLPRQWVTENTQAIAGVHYVLAARGITLTMPASPADGDCIAFTSVTGGETLIDWAGKTVKGVPPAPQAMVLPMRGHGAVIFSNQGQTWLPMPGIN